MTLKNIIQQKNHEIIAFLYYTRVLGVGGGILEALYIQLIGRDY